MQFAFVSTAVDDHGRLAGKDKALIRSHCMKGKNKKENSRRSRLEAKKRAAISKAEQSKLASSQDTDSSFSPDSAGRLEVEVEAWPENHPRFLWETRKDCSLQTSTSTEDDTALSRYREVRGTAARLGDYFSNSISHLPSFPEPIPAAEGITTMADHQLLHQFAQFARMKNTTFPIERCIDFDSYKYDHTPWLATDAAFFHSALFGQAALRDFVSRASTSSHLANYHLQRTLSLLNQRLTEPESYLMDSTIFIIMTLTFMSSMFGNYLAVEAHMQGLSQIIKIRGPDFLLQNPKLNFKLDNVDFRSCLASGRKPIFLIKPSWKPLFMGPYPPADDRIILESLGIISDPKLIQTFNDLQHLIRMTMDGHQRSEWVPVPKFQRAMHEIQSRLLNLDLISVDPIAELLRLSMIAFISTNFRIDERNLPYSYLAGLVHQTLDALSDHEMTDQAEWKYIVMWMLIVINMSDVEVEETKLRELWALYALGDMAWPDIHDQLLRVMWLSCFHDEIGRRAYTGLTWMEMVPHI